MSKNCVLTFLLVMSSINAVYTQPNVNKYQEILNSATKNGLPAIVALIQSPNEKEWKGKSGVSNIENAIPLNINESFRLASITKIFTAIIILQLVDQKKIGLSDNISKYLDTDIKSKIPYVDEITILQLLSHSSGIYSFSENNGFWKECFFEGGMSRIWKPDELISYIENKKPVSQPLEPYAEKLYSNTNYILLGMIIEKITSNPLSYEYQKRIFTPLKMNGTFLEGYNIQGRKAIDSYVVPNSYFLKSAVRRKDIKKVRGDKLINLSKEYKLFNSWAWAAGGVSSNINDLSSFFSAVRNQELLSDDTQKVLFQLNSDEENGIIFFGGTGGSDGIQATMLHLMPHDLVIIILINSSGHKQVNLNSIFVELLKTASNKK